MKDQLDILNDVALLQEMARGSTKAYEQLYEHYFDDIYQHVFSKIGEEEATKDIVHEIFLKLWEKRKYHNNVGNVKGYLFMITKNHILDIIARHKVLQKYYDSFRGSIGLTEGTDHLIQEKEINRYLEEAIDALPAKMRNIFELSRKEFLSHKEIADKLDISEKTVKTQINNALKVLRKKLHPFFHFFLF
ncbi:MULTISPECIES: RNA polymerase sigma factor [Sphingobacterium]|uniref:RNA polymerase sigma factor n=1 Tax=Sphingobacterium TaxID=28453 RepID=UPI0013DD392F|nr:MULTISPECIES: RNA polymerase sigma-70 factor [unclassified Sphingobacterium]